MRNRRWCCSRMLLLSLLVVVPAWGQLERPESEETVRARFQYWYDKRADAYGNFSMDAVLRAKAQIDSRRALQRAAKSISGQAPRTPQDAGIWNWQWLGPGNAGGRVEDLLIHPTNPNLMWVASPGGGIWKSTNRGASWFPINDFLPMLNVVTLAMCPLNDQIMYAGTGEYEYMGWLTNGRQITGTGIYKSTDGGNTWFLLPSTNIDQFHYVSRLAHQPGSYTHLLAATVTGLYQTTDAGVHWERIFTPDSLEPVRDVVYDPASPNRIWVGTTRDLYLTENSGFDWIRESTGALNKLPVSPGLCEIAVAPTNTNCVYVSVGNKIGQVFRTTDGGTTWKPRAFGTTANYYANAIWVSPTDTNFVIVGGTDNLLRDQNGVDGQFDEISDWRCYHNGRDTSYCKGFSPHGDFHRFVADPGFNGSTNRGFYVCDDGGVQYTSDISNVSVFSGWTNLANNLCITQFYGGSASPDGNIIVGGTQDLYNVSYYGNSPSWGSGYGGQLGWWNAATGDGGYTAIDYTNPRYLYVESQWLSVDKSADSGKSYYAARTGLGDTVVGNHPPGKCLFVAPLVMDPNNPLVLMAGGESIWRTTDSARNWTSNRLPIAGNPYCSAIDIYKSGSNVIWIGYNNGVVSYTTNAGGSWLNANQPWGNRFVTDIAINPTAMSPPEVIVTVGGYDTGNVWLTSNNGSSWVKRTGTAPNDLPALQVNTVRYHPLQPNWIYVGTDLGVFASEDKGLNWNLTPLYADNEGPLNTPVEELFWQGTSYLIAATHGRGMFRCRPLPIVYVDKDYLGVEDGTEFQPYNTVQKALNAYGPGAIISIKSNTYDEPAFTITKRGKIQATGGTVQIK